MKKNFEDISCVFCGEKNNISDPNCHSCNNLLSIHDNLINTKVNNNLTLIEYIARGFYGLTYKAVDNFGKEFAIKLISKESYKKFNKDFQSEAEMYARLPESQSIANYIRAGESTISFQGSSVDFYYIVSEWVKGYPLKEFLSKDKISSEDLITASRDLLTSLQELYDNNLWHNDLHDENILVSQISQTQMRALGREIPRVYKIIDIGSMVFKNPSDVKHYSDMTNVGSHLSQISKVLKKKFSNLSKEEQLFIDLMDDVCTQLMDESPSRTYSTPIKALDCIEDNYNLSRLGVKTELRKLTDPYGYINANDIPSSWLLKHMFSDKFKYFQDIKSIDQQTLLITGPRGCGKTMILKNMRFITLYDSEDEKTDSFLRELPYIGLFVSARVNFGNYLVSYRKQEWINDEKKVILYFNILITIEVIDVLYRLSFDGFAKNSDIDIVIKMIAERFSIQHINLHTAKAKLIQISKMIIDGENVYITIYNSTPAYLNDLLETFRSAIPAIKDKEIIILIDDLSLPRVPREIQKSIIPAIFNTGASYKTRVTAHSDGLITQDWAGEVYQTNRDFREINLGLEYWELSNNYDFCRDCFDDILHKRYELAGRDSFPGIETILGNGGKLNIGREIYQLYNQKKLRTLNYHGANVFIKLCSGDLSYLLDILGNMERLTYNNSFPISIKIQNKVIRNYARNELLSLQDIKAEYVPSLYNIAYSFGTWSKSKLVKKNAEHLRIEVELENLPEEAIATARELLCYGIFIDGGYGNMSDGRMCRRLLFRRIFTPAFPTTFNDRNTFPMRLASFKEFIYKPEDFVRKRMSEDKIASMDQQEMEQLEMYD